MPPMASSLSPPPTLGTAPLTPGLMNPDGMSPETNSENQAPDRNTVLPAIVETIVEKLELLSDGFDETNRRLGEYKQLFEDSRTAFTSLLTQQEKEHERVHARFKDTQQYEYDRHRENMAEIGLARYTRTAHWQGKLALTRDANAQLQQTQEAMTNQTAAILKGADTSARQAADIAKVADIFERVANTLDRVADPVRSLLGYFSANMQWLWNWGVFIFIVLIFTATVITIKYNNVQNSGSAPIIVGSNTGSRILSILMSNPLWKEFLRDPRPVFGDV